MRIIFMGTPDFAVPTLRTLCDHGYDIAAVVTVPDKPAGRGLQLQQSPVKEFAVSRGLKVLQPEKLRDPAFLDDLRSLNADLGIVVAFRMLPQTVWSMPRLGTLNLHASLLPNYRGAAPINHAIINGENQSGITTFFLRHEIDTGDILMQETVDIPESMTAGELHDLLMERGADLVLQTVTAIEAGNLQGKPQDENHALHAAPKIFRENCRIDWNKPLADVFNLIRGLSPYPAAWTTLDGKTLKIYSARKGESPAKRGPGYMIHGEDLLMIACADGYLLVDSLQLEGKKRMSTDEFIRGYKGDLDRVE